MFLGTVGALWRYPVKSMQGEEVTESFVSERGLLGDRASALQDVETGYIVSVKHPKKWGLIFGCRAAYAESPRLEEPLPHVWITLPDGKVISSAQPDTDQILSELLGRAVRLINEVPMKPRREADRTELDAPSTVIRQEEMALAAPPGTFFDYAPLHLLTAATLTLLKQLYPAGRFEVCRFRPNIVVDTVTEESGFVENNWLGKTMQIGDSVEMQGVDPCPRCIVTTLAQGGLPRDSGILRTIAKNNAAASVTLAPGYVFPAVAGIYVNVLRSGIIARGQSLELRKS